MEFAKPIRSSIVMAAGRQEMLRHGNLSGGALHRAMSQSFVRIFAQELRAQYSNRANVAVMSRDHPGYRLDFGMNELLFDIAVLEWGKTSGISSKENQLPFVKKGLLIVESELAENARSALHDFNKLILGNADNKLFIGPLVARDQAYRDSLAGAAEHCSGHLQLALVPHPRTWSDLRLGPVQTWTWKCGKWNPDQVDGK